jgi:hypothetical protein
MSSVKRTNAALHTLNHHVLNKMTYVMEWQERHVEILQKLVRLVAIQFVILTGTSSECRIMFRIVCILNGEYTFFKYFIFNFICVICLVAHLLQIQFCCEATFLWVCIGTEDSDTPPNKSG